MIAYNREFVAKRITQIINEYLYIKKDPEFITNRDFFKLGICCIEYINIIIAIEEFFAFDFDENKLTYSSFPKIDDLINYVYLKINILG